MSDTTTWVEATANQVMKVVIGLMVMGMLYLFQQGHKAQQAFDSVKIQWKKAAIDREKVWEYKVKQSYINGLNEGRLRCLEKG